MIIPLPLNHGFAVSISLHKNSSSATRTLSEQQICQEFKDDVHDTKMEKEFLLLSICMHFVEYK